MLCVVGAIQVIGVGRKFGRQRIDLSRVRYAPEIHTCLPYGLRLDTHYRPYCLIAESELLCFPKDGLRHRPTTVAKLHVHSHDLLYLLEEPAIYLRQRMDLIERKPLHEGTCDGKNPVGRSL